MAKNSRNDGRIARHDRLRKRIVGTSERPRLAVFRSLKHITAQIIDDSNGQTIVSASTLEKDLKATGNIGGAKQIGETIAKRALDKGIKQVVFDRGGFQYHGRIESLAKGARDAGLEF
jgi:large subunit ribosomal protein L18